MVVDVIVQLLKYGLVIGLVVAWASILLPPVARFFGGRLGRGADSIGSFRSHMSQLGGGGNRRTSGSGPVIDLTTRSVGGSASLQRPMVAAAPRRPSARKRRRDILTGLLASTGVLLLAGMAFGGVAWYAFGLAAVLLVSYVGLLWSIQQAHLERQRKVAYLPRNEVAPQMATDLRRVGAGRV